MSASSSSGPGSEAGLVANLASRAAAFLDRDGVINVDRGYVHRIEDFEFLPGALEGCRLLHRAGYRLIVVTNQAGIAQGFYDEAAFATLTRWMQTQFASAGAPLTAVYHCPHHPEAKLEALRRDCACRKPAPGLILRAIEDYQIDAARSVLIGDKPSDIEAAIRAGLPQRFLVRSAHVPPDEPDVFDSLLEVARHLTAFTTPAQSP